MPQGNNDNVTRHDRRRYLAALLLVPLAGCAHSGFAPRLPFSMRLPWVQNDSNRNLEAEQGTVVSNEKPLFHTAAFQMSAPDFSSGLFDGAVVTGEPSDATAPPPQLPPPDPIIAAPAMVSPEAPISLADNAHRFEEPIIDALPQFIDLSSALGMAGGNAWIVQLARQRTMEAHAELTQARALWLPSLQFGVGWNKHDGRLQETEGNVFEASRGSLFVGGGATMGEAPIAGGSNGPLRLSADMALADAYFAPKIASRQLSAQKAGVSIAHNQALLDAGIAYVNLVESAGQIADARAAIIAADELLNLTRAFADAGAGALADVDRAATERARLTGALQNANRLYRVRSANLARRLRLDPVKELQPADKIVMPIELAADDSDVDSLIRHALAHRPEVNALSHEIASLCLAVRQADVEPWIPKVSVASSAGSFSGGTGSDLSNEGGRSDVDLQAVWELESLGVGVAAKRAGAASRLAQRRIRLSDLRDQISADVVAAYEDVVNYRLQIDAATEAMSLADASYDRNLQRVRADEGLPIELLQAINARTAGLRDRTAAVANYNRAQLRLLYATGQLRP